MSEQFADWYDELEPAILIKVEDFHILGYREITAHHIWSFLTEVIWKNSSPALHTRINDVMQMNIGQLMQAVTGSVQNEPTSVMDEALIAEVLDEPTEE
ncbi:post-transcriptional regulator [Listeria costaricensis]|uniref:post-transcriptional regulator n=1 Tax=Listeria costaricensis TaxID=2026604 RepID=UPI000C08C5B8|nr:post-transcriptional regulator [Listeria costaricensis]